MRLKSRLAWLTASYAVLCLVVGCGPSEPPTFHISGTVTYAGKPIPRGSISFDPDSRKGTLGKMGVADITNGKFDTKLGGHGLCGGTYNIRISGYDGKEGMELPFGNAMFPEYAVQKEIPKAESTLEIDVPKAAK
jgi:hypothetical protein